MSSSSQSDPLVSATDPSSLSDPSTSSSSSSTPPSSSSSKSSNSSSNSSNTSKPATDNTSSTNTGSKSNSNAASTDGKSGSISTSPPTTGDLSTLNPSGSTTGTTPPSTGGTNGSTNSGSTGNTGSTTGGRTSTTNDAPVSPALDPVTTSSTTATSRTSTTAAAPTSTVSTPTSSVPTTTAPASSSSAPAATHSSATLGMLTSTIVPSPTVVLSTFTPSATGLPAATSSAAPSEGSSTNLIGPVIGGIAGGLVGIILLTWLILIPIRRRAEQRKEVDWMPFGSDNDHLNDSGNDSLYRTPRSGVAETETKPMDSPDMYQMSDIGSNANHTENIGSLYSHLDRNPSNPSRSTHAAGATEGYMVANDVVGDMPPNHYPPIQPPVYYSHALAAQQQQQMYAGYGGYSPNTSPEMAARRFVGQENAWVQSPASNQGHPGAAPMLRNQKSFNHPASHPINPHQAQGLNRNPSAGSAPAYVSPQHTHAMPAPLPHGMHKQALPQKELPSPEQEDDSQLAYAQDAIGTPRPDNGPLSNLHVVNSGTR